MIPLAPAPNRWWPASSDADADAEALDTVDAALLLAGVAGVEAGGSLYDELGALEELGALDELGTFGTLEELTGVSTGVSTGGAAGGATGVPEGASTGVTAGVATGVQLELTLEPEELC